jgi:hypothetical protein
MNQGWMLTKEGALVPGKTGYLLDENNLFILTDGRRVTEEHIKYEGNDLRIGKDDPGEGLDTILAHPDAAHTAPYNVRELFEQRGLRMSDVVYQAFQINSGYTLISNNRVIENEEAPGLPGSWMRCGAGSNVRACFGVIGADETGIPIVVTRIGEEGPDKKKLVIASPHGDERNAQRLIMRTQRYFIQHGAPAGMVLYCIPCISPAMAFADARGIPNEFWNEFTEYGIGMNPGAVKSFTLKRGELTIPKLHDSMTAGMRYNMQTFRINGPSAHPRYGVDANRDEYFSLQSGRCFKAFIEWIYRSAGTSAKTKSAVRIYDTVEKKYHEPTEQSFAGNIQVFMIHGYESGGGIFGPYFVKVKGENEVWPAAVSAKDKDRVNKMTHILFNRKWKKDADEKTYHTTRNDPHLYGTAGYDARPYQGEWSRVLFDLGVWPADIELPGGSAAASYDEGIRGDGDRPYCPSMVGDTSKPLLVMHKTNRFIRLIRKAPWPG